MARKGKRKGKPPIPKLGGVSYDAAISNMQGQIGTTRRALRKDRMGDYRAGRQVSNAAQSRFEGQIKLTGRRMTRGNKRTFAAMERLTDRAQRQPARVRGAVAQTGAEYGGVYQGEAGRQFAPARSLAKGGVTAAVAQEKQGQFNVGLGKNLIRQTKAGASESQAAADYALAKALSSRSQADAATLAQMQFELMQTQLQHQQALEMAAMQHRYSMEESRKSFQQQKTLLQKQTAGVDSELANVVTGISDTVSEVAPVIANMIYRNPDITTDEIINALLNDPAHQFAVDAGNMRVFRRVVANIRDAISENQGTGDKPDVAGAVMETIRTFYPTYFQGKTGDKHLNTIKGIIASAMDYDAAQRAAKESTSAQDGEIDTDSLPSFQSEPVEVVQSVPESPTSAQLQAGATAGDNPQGAIQTASGDVAPIGSGVIAPLNHVSYAEKDAILAAATTDALSNPAKYGLTEAEVASLQAGYGGGDSTAYDSARSKIEDVVNAAMRAQGAA